MRKLSCSVVLAVLTVGGIPLVALGQPMLQTIERQGEFLWHPSKSSEGLRYVIPTQYLVAKDSAGEATLQLTKHEFPPALDAETRSSLQGGSLQFRLVNPPMPEPENSRRVPVVWHGLGFEIPGGRSRRFISISHPTSSEQMVIVPLERDQVDLLWPEFGSRKPLPMRVRGWVAYSGLLKIAHPGVYVVHRERVASVVGPPGTTRCWSMESRNAQEEMAAAVIAENALEPKPGDLSPIALQAVFGAIRANMLEYVVHDSDAALATFSVRVREGHDRGSFELPLVEWSYAERATAVSIDLAQGVSEVRRLKSTLEIPFDGAAIGQSVTFLCDLEFPSHGIQQVYVDGRYSEAMGGPPEEKRLVLKAEDREKSWRLQVRYPSRAELSYRVTIIRGGQAPTRRIVQSPWIRIWNPPYNFSAPAEHVHLNGPILSLLNEAHK